MGSDQLPQVLGSHASSSYMVALGFVASLAVCGCASDAQGPGEELHVVTSSAAGPGVAGSVAPRPRPIKGWDSAYDDHIRQEVARAPALLELAPARIEAFCPLWAAMSRPQREGFYADLLYAIAWPESRHDRRVIAQEPGIVDPSTGRQAIDAVTGKPILSEGLLQLSYADQVSYPPALGLACHFDWDRDRDSFLADLATGGTKPSFKSTHPDRTILDPYVQFTCAIHVLDVLVRKKPNREFRAAAGVYWSTMRPARPAHAEVVQAMRKRASPCFVSP